MSGASPFLTTVTSRYIWPELNKVPLRKGWVPLRLTDVPGFKTRASNFFTSECPQFEVIERHVTEGFSVKKLVLWSKKYFRSWSCWWTWRYAWDWLEPWERQDIYAAKPESKFVPKPLKIGVGRASNILKHEHFYDSKYVILTTWRKRIKRNEKLVKKMWPVWYINLLYLFQTVRSIFWVKKLEQGEKRF